MNNAEGFDAPIRSPSIRTQDWVPILQQLHFPGDLQKGANLMTQVVKGMEWVRSTVLNQDASRFRMPTLCLSFSESDIYRTTFAYDEEQNLLSVDIRDLIQFSKYGTHELLRMRDNFDVDLFRGTAIDYFILGPGHETDHAKYFQLNPGSARPKNEQVHPDSVTTAEYDSQPWELSALRTELEIAKAHHAPPITIEVYKSRIAMAEALLND